MRDDYWYILSSVFIHVDMDPLQVIELALVFVPVDLHIFLCNGMVSISSRRACSSMQRHDLNIEQESLPYEKVC